MSSRKGQPCVLCGVGESTRQGEHVLPSWLLGKYFAAADGPYTSGPTGAKAGDPGTVTRTEFKAIKLACCTPCNVGKLNPRFENPGKLPALAVFEGRGHELSPADADHARLWLLKTWLFLTHPRIENLFLAGAAWDDAPSTIYDWTVTDAPPPDDLSAWAFWLDGSQETPDDAPVIYLPTVVEDGVARTSRVLDISVGNVCVALVYHPGVTIEHPGEADGSVVRLWPSPAGTPIPPLPRGTTRPASFRVGMTYWPQTPAFGAAPPVGR